MYKIWRVYFLIEYFCFNLRTYLEVPFYLWKTSFHQALLFHPGRLVLCPRKLNFIGRISLWWFEKGSTGYVCRREFRWKNVGRDRFNKGFGDNWKKKKVTFSFFGTLYRKYRKLYRHIIMFKKIKTRLEKVRGIF